MARPTGTGTLRDKNLKRLIYTSERYLTGYRSMMRFIPRSDSPKKVASGYVRVNADTQLGGIKYCAMAQQICVPVWHDRAGAKPEKRWKHPSSAHLPLTFKSQVWSGS